jgi:hypothetical protein
MIIVYVLWVCKHDWWFFPSLALGGGGGGLGGGGWGGSGYIYSTSTHTTCTNTHPHINTHTHPHTLTNKYAIHRSIHLSVYLFIDLLIYLPCFDTFCSFLGLGVSYWYKILPNSFWKLFILLTFIFF